MEGQLSLRLGDVLAANNDGLILPIDGTITPRVEQLDRVLGNLGRQFLRRFPSADLVTELEAQLDLPVPLGRAATIEVSGAPFRAVILVSSLHHVEQLDGTSKRALVRTCMRSALEAAARAKLGSVATGVLQGGWRLPPDAALSPMIDAVNTYQGSMTVDIHCIDSAVFKVIAPMARAMGARIVE